MAFGFGDIGSMFSHGMAQYGQGLDKMRALPLDQKMMAAGQVMKGGVSPMSMMGAVDQLGRPAGAGLPPQVAPGSPPVVPPSAPPAAPVEPATGQPQQQHGNMDWIMQGLLPMLMGSGGLGSSSGLATGGASGLLSGSGLGMGLGGLLGKFGFGGH